MNIIDIGESLERRFYEKIKVNLFDLQGCILWQGSTAEGYGQLSDGKNVTYKAHVISYALYYGESPSGRYVQIDHECRNRACVNPLHLRKLTQRENILIGQGLAAKNHNKTHCKNGHEFTEENTYIPKHGVNAGHRFCKECNRIRNRKYVR